MVSRRSLYLNHYLTYVNDFFLTSKFKSVMFVDDTILFLSDENTGQQLYQLNKELKSVSSCFKANKLSTNIGKTKLTIFHPTSKTCFMPTEFPELFIDGITLKSEKVTKFLAVFID